LDGPEPGSIACPDNCLYHGFVHPSLTYGRAYVMRDASDYIACGRHHLSTR
jgi:hypothetical protein